jgi:vesicle coat complex subunit
MTVGKDVSQLFPDVVNCMQTDNLELKKLVYLYLMNYAKTQPEMAILAVNTFAKVNEESSITKSNDSLFLVRIVMIQIH